MEQKGPSWEEMYQEAYSVISMIRDTIEELGPVGIIKNTEYCFDIHDDGNAIVEAIQKLTEK